MLASQIGTTVVDIAAMLKPGRVQIADIMIGKALPDAALRDVDPWTG